MTELSKAFIRHTIEYPDGTVYKGKIDHRAQPALAGIDSVEGMRVLDIATNDGFFAFWSEWHGAKEVMAIDVDTYENYDWGSHEVPESVGDIFQPDKAVMFKKHYDATNSKIDKRCMSIMDLDKEKHGSFDLIWNYGLLYHLRDPLGSLDICRKICDGMMVLETQVHPNVSLAPVVLQNTIKAPFIPITNFSVPNERAVVAWLDSAGFDHIFVENNPKIRTRQHFIACVTDELAEKVRSNTKFRECGLTYFKSMRKNGHTAAFKGDY